MNTSYFGLTQEGSRRGMKAVTAALCVVAALAAGCEAGCEIAVKQKPAGEFDHYISRMAPFRSGCLYEFSIHSETYLVYVPHPCRETEEPEFIGGGK